MPEMVVIHHPVLVKEAQGKPGYDPSRCQAAVTLQAFNDVWKAKGFKKGPAPAAKKTKAKETE